MIINNKFETPYNKFPPAESLPILSRPLVNSKLTEEFWKITKNIFEKTLKEDFGKDNQKLKNNNNKNLKSNEITNSTNNNINNINKDNNIKDVKDNNSNNYNLNVDNEKKIYIEKYKLLKRKNDNLNNIILQQEEENKLIVKRIEELETILNNKNFNII